MSLILNETIANDLKPLKVGGITLYPASALGRLFEWAQGSSRKLEWVEGLFYDPQRDEGQLSTGYIVMREETDYGQFRAECLSIVPEIEAEAMAKGMSAYFEVGISE